MRTLGMLCGIGALLASTSAFAQADLAHPTVRLDTGASVAVGSPQADYFGPGGTGMLKLAFNLTPWLDVDPSVQAIFLSENTSSGPGSSVGGTTGLGLGARLKRPHNVDDGTYWGPSSPWIDVDYQYYRTSGLNRMGVSVGVGLSAPLDDNRHWWLGPMVRFNQVVDGTSVGGTVGNDTRDARIFSMGLELEFDVVGRKVPAAPPPAVVVVNNPPPVVEEKKPAVDQLPPPQQDATETTLVAAEMVYFDFDSADVSEDSKVALDEIAKLIKEHLTITAGDPLQRKLKSVQVDGHASSENHPWAEKHNQQLSEKRAQAVVDYLVSKGVPGEVLSAKGFGTSKPIASNDTETGRQINRRVEFELTVSFVRPATSTKESGQ